MNRSRVGYDRLAPWYESIERCVFGRRLQAARCLLIDQLLTFDRALVLGDGDGRLLAELATRFEGGSLVSVDHSRRMILAQQSRLTEPVKQNRVTWLHADALALPLVDRSFDLLVTAFVTDCFDEPTLQTALPCWSRLMRSSATWLHVDFVMPPPGLSRVIAGTTSLAMHAFFRWQTGLPNRRLFDPHPIIQQSGWRPMKVQAMSHPFVRATLYSNR